MRLPRRCPRLPADAPCSRGLGHGGRCWPPAVLPAIGVSLAGMAVLGWALTMGRRDIVAVLGDPLSLLVFMALGVELVVLVYGPVYAQALRDIVHRLRR
jgi:hypothetical protein